MKRLIMGVAIGAGAMYLLDPEKGAERRGRLLGFYGENKDSFQDYAQTAAQTAVTVSHTVSDVASTVVDKAGEITGKSTADTGSDEKVGAPAANGGASKARVDEVLGGRSTTRKSTAAGDPPPGDAPGLGGSLSS
ncbi:MAG: hypothetical protein QOK05_2799 [Chloroflexota bacterium]|jgi:gas vesicle protein|nr:hypothetical protein [Chloroflexota bacterium]